MPKKRRLLIAARRVAVAFGALLFGGSLMPTPLAADDAALASAVTFYASFDAGAEGDFGQGERRLWTRADDPSQKDKKVVRLGYDEKSIHIAGKGGVSGGA